MKWPSKEPGNENTLTTSKKDLASETFFYQESEQYETERALDKQQHARKNCQISLKETNHLKDLSSLRMNMSCFL